MNPQELEVILDLVKAAQVTGLAEDEVRKAGWTTGTGLTMYDLQAPAIAIYPWLQSLVPLRNELARVKGNGDTATHWKAITGINTTNVLPGVSQGNRGAIVTTTVEDFSATYQGLGLEDSVTFEAQDAAEGFDDPRARAVEGLLRSLMLQEELVILGGNSSIALGTTPTPTLAAHTTGGSLADATYYVGCVALTFWGNRLSTVAAGVPQVIVRTNADNTTDTINGGSAGKSAVANVAVSGGSGAGSLGMSVAAVRGAVAYAWYIGTASGHQYLTAITTLNSYLATVAPAGTEQDFATMAAGDYSRQNGYVFDGVLYSTAFRSTSNAYYRALATGTVGTGTALTSDGAAGIVEINTAFQSFWDNYKLGPETIWASAGGVQDMTKLVIANGGAPLARYTGDLQSVAQNIIGGNNLIGLYLNKFTGQLVKVRIHPNLPDGVILFTCNRIPYQASGVSTCHQIKYRRDYYQIEWAWTSRRYPYGVYCDETYQNYTPFAFGAITNVARS